MSNTSEPDIDYVECSIIGGCLSDEGCIELLIEYLAPNQFNTTQAKNCYQEILTLYKTYGWPAVDVLAVANSLATRYTNKAGYDPDRIRVYLGRCLEVPTPKHMVIAAATRVKQTSRERQIKTALAQALNSDTLSFDNSLLEVSRMISDSTTEQFIDTIVSMDTAFAKWKEAANYDFAEGGLTTGWPTIDKGLNRPIAKGEVIAIAARTGVGKTHGATSIVRNALRRNKEAGALFASLEMPLEEITERFVAQALNVDPENMRLEAVAGNIDYTDVFAADDCMDRIRLYDYDLSIQQLPSVITRAAKSGIDPRLVVVDYMGLMQWDGHKGVLGYEKVSEIARQFKSVAKRTGTSIIACAQLSREAGDGTTPPTMDMIRDSGAIEEACDRIFGMWRDSQYVYVRILKNRHGPIGATARLSYSMGLELQESISDAVREHTKS